MVNKYDFKVGQVWKTIGGDRFIILAVGPDYIGWKYDKSSYSSCSIRCELDQDNYELVKPKIKKRLTVFRGTGHDVDTYLFQDADGDTTDEGYWKRAAKIEVEFEEGQGLDPCICKKKCQCNRWPDIKDEVS